MFAMPHRARICRIVLSVLLASVAIATAHAQKKQRNIPLEVGAYVKDHLTHEQIPNLKGELLMAADSSFVDSLSIIGEAAAIRLENRERYLMRLHADGYVTAYVPFDATKTHKNEKYRQLPPVYMRKLPKKLEVELGEVVVKSTLLKFYMDGDTLVYNADAFPMAEGSMLGELMKKLPGVEVEDGGVIKINGRQIDAMLLNGKDFFDKDKKTLLENMPSYMVKSFNAYERTPDMVLGTIAEKTTPKEYVMDVRLKKEYSVGWIANAEAGGGATFFDNDKGNKDGKYLGRVFGLRFTKNSRMVAYVNANNLNDSHKPGEQGDWGQLSQSEGLTSTIKAGANYRYEEDWSGQTTFQYGGSIDGSYSDKDNAEHTSSATFLDNGNTFGKSFYTKRSYEWEVNTEHQIKYRQLHVKNLMKNFYIHMTPKLSYQTWDDRIGSASATLAEDVASGLGKAWMDSITAPHAGEMLKRYAINRTMTAKKGIGHQLEAHYNGFLSCTPAYNDFIVFGMTVFVDASDLCSDNYEHYLLDYPKAPMQETDYRNRFIPKQHKAHDVAAFPVALFALDHTNNQTIKAQYGYTYSHSDSNNPLYLMNRLEGWEQPNSHPLGMLPSMEEVLTAIDQDNSSRSVWSVHQQSPNIEYNLFRHNPTTYTNQTFIVSFGANIEHEMLDYQQGVRIDTLMRRNNVLPTGRIFYDNNMAPKGRQIQASYDFNVAAPSMTSLLNIRNDSDPLNITLGNPNLKNTTTHNLYFSYRDKFGKTLFNANLRGSLSTNAVAYGFIYDRETGIRTTKPENVNGNWSAHTESGIDLPLDKADRWRLRENVSYDYNHSVDMVGTNGAAEATRSTVGSHYLTDKLSLRYRPTKKLEFGVNGSLTYQNSTSNRESFQTLNVFTYHYGVNAQMELPLGLQLSTDLTMYSRRGYSEPSMNTNELVWNARLAKRLMHGNLTLMFDGFDLLGNLSNVRRSINAQGRTETFYNVIPSYGLFHAVYRLNKQPKK